MLSRVSQFEAGVLVKVLVETNVIVAECLAAWPISTAIPSWAASRWYAWRGCS